MTMDPETKPFITEVQQYAVHYEGEVFIMGSRIEAEALRAILGELHAFFVVRLKRTDVRYFGMGCSIIGALRNAGVFDLTAHEQGLEDEGGD